MTKKTIWFVAVAMLMGVGMAWAQQAKQVPPPPKPTDNGPSLEVTMKFIQDKINSVGPINYVSYVHDGATGQDWSGQFRQEQTPVVASPASCRVDFHWKTTRNGEVTEDQPAWFYMKAVTKITVIPKEQLFKEIDTANGHPSYNCKVDPPVYVLKVQRNDNGSNIFQFFDEELANRVAKAITHAVELCGGGQDKEPF